MDSELTALKENVERYAKRASRLWVAARVMLESSRSPESVCSALELNSRAIEECRRALNTLDFIRRYTKPDPEPPKAIPRSARK